MAKLAFGVADIRLPTDLLASTEPIGQATLGIPFPRHLCMHRYRRAAALRLASAQLLMKSAHSSFAALGLGRSRIHVGSASFAHISNASCSAWCLSKFLSCPSGRACIVVRSLQRPMAYVVCIFTELHLLNAACEKAPLRNSSLWGG